MPSFELTKSRQQPNPIPLGENGLGQSSRSNTAACRSYLSSHRLLSPTVIVLSRKNMSTSTNCYLMGLAIADLLFLFLLASILADNQFEPHSKGFYMYQVRGSLPAPPPRCPGNTLNALRQFCDASRQVDISADACTTSFQI